MAKIKSTRETPPDTLQLRTLSGTYESARAVVRLTNIEVNSTYEQLTNELRKLLRDKDKIKMLYNALESLDKHTATLGIVTLVRAQDHPLVTRHTLPKE